MDRLDAMAAFVAAVEDGSLAAAARRLNCSPAAVTRAIAALEDRLGTRLLHRSARALTLTGFGADYLTTCRKILDDLATAERGAAAERDMPRGMLSVTAPLLFGQMKLRPVIDRFLAANPAVQIRLLLLDRIVSVVDEGMDVAVRLAHLPDSSLIASHLGEVRRILCAAPRYLEQHGRPASPADLQNHRCIMFSASGAEVPWSFAASPQDQRRALQPVAVRPRLIVNSSTVAIDAALEGQGIARVMSYQVAEHLAAGRLILLLAQYEAPPLPVHLVFAQARPIAAKLRAFTELATPMLRDELTRIGRTMDALSPL